MDPIEQLRQRTLVIACQLGDRRALDRLFERHHAALGYYLRRMLNRDDVLDVQQDVWLTVIRRIGQLREPASFAVWLYKIARRHALDRLSSADCAFLSTDALEVADSREEPQFDTEDAERIHREIAHLSAKHREVLALRFMDELSYDEIAQVLGCTTGTVRSRLHYAKLALRERWEERR
jgi:RNA polymerase sigma-70 factor, ECF subfamily